MNAHCKISSVQKRDEKDLFGNKLSKSKLNKDSQVFDQLNKHNISLEEVANDIDVKEMLARISQYKERFSEARNAKLWFHYQRIVEIICILSKQKEKDILIFTNSLWERLPYFTASGHHLFARLAHTYQQTM